MILNMVGAGNGGGGSSDFEKVMNQGQISDTVSYKTAYFTEPLDTSRYSTFLILLFYDNAIVGSIVAPSNQVSASEYTFKGYFTANGHGSPIDVKMSTTSIRTTNYSGSYLDIYADVYGMLA